MLKPCTITLAICSRRLFDDNDFAADTLNDWFDCWYNTTHYHLSGGRPVFFVDIMTIWISDVNMTMGFLLNEFWENHTLSWSIIFCARGYYFSLTHILDSQSLVPSREFLFHFWVSTCFEAYLIFADFNGIEGTSLLVEKRPNLFHQSEEITIDNKLITHFSSTNKKVMRDRERKKERARE